MLFLTTRLLLTGSPFVPSMPLSPLIPGGPCKPAVPGGPGGPGGPTTCNILNQHISQQAVRKHMLVTSIILRLFGWFDPQNRNNAKHTHLNSRGVTFTCPYAVSSQYAYTIVEYLNTLRILPANIKIIFHTHSFWKWKTTYKFTSTSFKCSISLKKLSIVLFMYMVLRKLFLCLRLQIINLYTRVNVLKTNLITVVELRTPAYTKYKI
jgi:hypothetical protein